MPLNQEKEDAFHAKCNMARGQRKTVEEKIIAKQELIDSLLIRIESEKKELQQLFDEKKKKELEVVNDLIDEAGLAPDEVVKLLQSYIDSQTDKSA